MTRVNGRADPPRVPVVVQRCVSSMLNVLDLNLPKRWAFYTAPMASDNAQLDVLVVGMGFAGTTIARALADAGKRVHLVENAAITSAATRTTSSTRRGAHPSLRWHTFTRIRIASSNFCPVSRAGVPMNTGSSRSVDGQLLPFPINRTTINKLYGQRSMRQASPPFWSACAFRAIRLLRVKMSCCPRRSAIFATCSFAATRANSGRSNLSELSAGVAARIPVRTSDDDRYFTDRHQCMPADGYTAMFERMLDHPLISWETGDRILDRRIRTQRARHLVYTGPIDAYFGFRHGKLPYRSLEFRHEHLHDTEQLSAGRP